MKFLKKIVILSLTSCLVFTVAVIALNCFGIFVSDVQIEQFYSVFGKELLATAFIKIADAVISRFKNKDEIADMKKAGVKPEREDFKTDPTTDYSIYGG